MKRLNTQPIQKQSKLKPPSIGWRRIFTWSYFQDQVKENPVAYYLLIIAVIIGFFHGWLKRAYPGGIMTFAYDIPLMLALVAALIKVPQGKDFFPASRTGIAIKIIIGFCIIYGLFPTGIPYLVRFASFRGWALIPLMFLLGYHVFRKSEQLNYFGYLVTILCIITTIYGARQDPEELRRLALADPAFQRTMNGSFYLDEAGLKFRVFSTFISAGAFSATMAYGILINFAKFSRARVGIWDRIGLAVLMLPPTYGVFLSGSRTAIIIVLVTIMIIAWYSGNLLKIALPSLGTLVVLLLVGNSMGVSSISRMTSIFDSNQIWGRLSIVVLPGFYILLDHPLGGGLGRSGHGVPMILEHLKNFYEIRDIDGDLGKAAVDFGLLGMVAYIMMFVRGVQDSVLWMKGLKGTIDETLAVTAGSMFITAFLTFPTGSPFLSIPMGALIWIYLGALNRIYDEKNPKQLQGRFQLKHNQTNGSIKPAYPADSTVSEIDLKDDSTKQPKKRFIYN